MRISTRAIVSNSDMIKNYKSCREKAEELGRIYILKNNQPDAVLFSIHEYERLSGFFEHIERLNDHEIKNLIKSLSEKPSTVTIDSKL